MNEIPKVTGNQLVDFIESIGCNKRDEFNDNSVVWSVFTGNFFVVPSYTDEYLDTATLKYIISELGITEHVFINMWNDYTSSTNTNNSIN